MRDYAKAVGLDPDEVVDDFCRLFPLGDRRALPVIAATAELIGHDTTATDDPRLMPDGIDRRASPGDPAEPPPQSVRLARIFRAIFTRNRGLVCAAMARPQRRPGPAWPTPERCLL